MEASRAAEAEAEKLAEQERLRDEEQRRRIQDALNRQTFTQVRMQDPDMRRCAKYQLSACIRAV